MKDASTGAFDVLIVGAGFAGLYALHKLRELGFAARVVEAGEDIGGTWYWNRYPGARCDVESVEYSYSFDKDLYRNWDWTERFATQPEILKYINYVADRLDLRRDVQLGTRVVSARFDGPANRWIVATDRTQEITAQFLVMATGCLSSADLPRIEGREEFGGAIYHTPHWPKEETDFAGRSVGLIGTGSTGIQLAPVLAPSVGQLTIFQRTACYSVPAKNAPLAEERRAYWKANVGALKERARNATPSGVIYEFPTKSTSEASPEERRREYERRWEIGGAGLGQSFNDIIVNEEANGSVAEFVRQKIRAIVKDKDVAAALCPSYPIFTKRICLDSAYYEMFNRPNVRLVPLGSSGIERITARGVVVGGVEHPVDDLIFATGFDAVTGALNRIHIENADGRTLKEKWRDGPKTYLGLMTADFPNLLTITGPGSPSILSNVIISIEEHVDWIAACLTYLGEQGFDRIEATSAAEEEWVEHVAQIAAGTLFPRAPSWYMGANIPGKPRVFLPYAGGVGTYHRKLDEIVSLDYPGFRFSTHEARRKNDAEAVS